MAGFSNYLEDELLDHVFGNAAFTAPTTVYVALADTTITDSTTGTTISEPSGGSYARVSVTNNKTNFSASSGGSVQNDTAITFTQATGSWGTVTDFAIIDAASNGNILAYGALTASKAVGSGDTVSFAVGDLTITLD